MTKIAPALEGGQGKDPERRAETHAARQAIGLLSRRRLL
jgi:hypothetical protein